MACLADWLSAMAEELAEEVASAARVRAADYADLRDEVVAVLDQRSSDELFITRVDD